jgi:glyoxylase-like metal-dependent hydrolase (beta-lactamase superfamily II)
MHRERVSENVYWFQIDTLALPEETLTMREFIEHELGVQVRYVIDTHYHADHCWGNCFFPGATIIGHAKCREYLVESGTASLEASQRQNPSLRQVKIVPPHLTFKTGEMTLRVGKKNLIISTAAGHSPDGISVLVEEDRVLFAGDSFMPLPYIVDGDIDDMLASVKKIGRMGLENIIQGHGDIILRGEIDAAVKENINYLNNIKKLVKSTGKRKNAEEYLEEITIEECGKSRVHLGGLAETLHRRNLRALRKQMFEA